MCILSRFPKSSPRDTGYSRQLRRYYFTVVYMLSRPSGLRWNSYSHPNMAQCFGAPCFALLCFAFLSSPVVPSLPIPGCGQRSVCARADCAVWSLQGLGVSFLAVCCSDRDFIGYRYWTALYRSRQHGVWFRKFWFGFNEQLP